ncbi:MAG: hypothetical protein FWD57_06415 [Polyangiaceae bacterium]|nr:hypothetical protein [Polyangiaceae bacterium]
MRSVDEERASRLIAQVLSEEGLEATGPRPVLLQGGVSVTQDVGVQNRKLGFVYLTAADAREIEGDSLATRPEGSDLTVRLGDGGDVGMRVVILYESDYAYDESAGSGRTATVVSAENRLTRDARDFVIIARKNRWK